MKTTNPDSNTDTNTNTGTDFDCLKKHQVICDLKGDLKQVFIRYQASLGKRFNNHIPVILKNKIEDSLTVEGIGYISDFGTEVCEYKQRVKSKAKYEYAYMTVAITNNLERTKEIVTSQVLSCPHTIGFFTIGEGSEVWVTSTGRKPKQLLTPYIQ